MKPSKKLCKYQSKISCRLLQHIATQAMSKASSFIVALYTQSLKETRNSFEKWSLNLRWISNKTIMKIGNVSKAATFKSFFHQSYKNTQLLFCDSSF